MPSAPAHISTNIDTFSKPSSLLQSIYCNPRASSYSDVIIHWIWPVNDRLVAPSPPRKPSRFARGMRRLSTSIIRYGFTLQDERRVSWCCMTVFPAKYNVLLGGFSDVLSNSNLIYCRHYLPNANIIVHITVHLTSATRSNNAFRIIMCTTVLPTIRLPSAVPQIRATPKAMPCNRASYPLTLKSR